jgi:thiol:disulfide interchange protein DsbC
MKPYTRALICSLAGSFVCMPFALAQAQNKPDPRVEIAGKIPGAKPEDLRQSPMQGVYELMRGTDVAYVSGDGKYAIAGDMFDLKSNENITENRRRDARAKLLSTIPESQMLVFGPKDAKHTITVFTDVDCGYCRKLHSQMAEYNKAGIRVRYLFYPRSGPDTESWTKAQEVWCAANRNDAMTKAKRGEELNVKVCNNTPIQRHYELGQEFAIRGTPAIIMGTGEMLPGYVPPSALAEHLRTSAR